LTGKVSRRSAKSGSSDKHRNGEVYNPDGIELVYVAGADKGIIATPSFYIGKYEITQTQWKAIMGNNPSHFKGGNLPVETVSWNDVQKFLTRLNAKTGRNYRLPTEAEWEFAAGGGTVAGFCKGGCVYSGSDKIDRVAWYKKNSKNRTHPVGTKAPNELGIYDMTGNVWEWCEDLCGDSQQHRNVRGGSWYRNAENCHIHFRAHDAPDVRSYNIGFRVVLPVK
jgi:formylglycine-generating enzyme required for sulfatase activity